MAETDGYWWDDDPSERYWVEIRKRPGIGASLSCPLVNLGGTKSGAYELLDALASGDVVYHWHARESKFVGRSIVASPRSIVGDQRIVPLVDFTPLPGDVNLETVRSLESEIYALRDSLRSAHPSATTYLPFQFRADGLRLTSYYFGKLPRQLVGMLFGKGAIAGRAGKAGPAPDSSNAVRRHFLRPFRPKADTRYVTRITGGTQVKDRHHETLVNRFTAWLNERGIDPGCNQAIDLGLEVPPVVIEAKTVKSWPKAIREAVGQLYEYRYFQVANPTARLVLLTNKPIPESWHDYLESDRGISFAWMDGDEFVVSPEAMNAMGLDGD